MATKHKEISKLDAIRNNITKLSELVTVGKVTKDAIRKHPVRTAAGVLVVGMLAALVSGSLIRGLLKLISFGLRVSAFIFVIKQTLKKFKR